MKFRVKWFQMGFFFLFTERMLKTHFRFTIFTIKVCWIIFITITNDHVFFCLLSFFSSSLFFFVLNCYFVRRKWLPQPLRKLSQGKVDKTTASAPSASSASASSSAAAPNDRPFIKKGSEKAFKLAASVTAEEEQPLSQKTNVNRFRDKSNMDSHQKSDVDQQTSQPTHSADIENEEEVVLPPPMKPIQDSQAIINNGPTVQASSVVEQSPCKRVSSPIYLDHLIFVHHSL